MSLKGSLNGEDPIAKISAILDNAEKSEKKRAEQVCTEVEEVFRGGGQHRTNTYSSIKQHANHPDVVIKKYRNYCSSLKILVTADKENLENTFIISGIIYRFFIQFELAWKVMKELLRYEGNGVAGTGSPSEILKAAYGTYGFLDERIWLSMLKDRNDMTHIYDGNAAKELVERILRDYIPAFSTLQTEIETRYQEILDTL